MKEEKIDWTHLGDYKFEGKIGDLTIELNAKSDWSYWCIISGDQVIDDHRFHNPMKGELDAKVKLQKIVEKYL